MPRASFANANNGSATAGTTSGTIVAANGARTYLRVMNNSDTPIYLSLGSAAILNKGIYLGTAGTPQGVFEMDRQSGNLYTGTVFGICSAAKSVVFLEGSG